FFVLANIQTNQAGTYNVGVVNAAGNSALSSNAFLTVVIPPSDQATTAGSNATFTVNAVSPNASVVRLQWQFNGTNLPNATNASLTLNNAQPSDAGPYSVVITLATNNGPAPASFSANLALISGDS